LNLQDTHWNSVMTLLAGVNDLHQFVFTMPRFREGAPDLVLGIWGDRETLTKLLGGLRETLQDERDRAVLGAAAPQYCAAANIQESACRPTVQELIESGWVESERHPRFHRFTIASGHARAPPSEGVGELVAPPGEANFLIAPINGNDRRYRPDLAKADEAALTSDRYRFPYKFKDDVLWIASGPGDLEVLDRNSLGASSTGLEASPEFTAATSKWASRSRAWVYFNTDRLVSMERDRAASENQSDSEPYLNDLRNHVAFSLEARPLSDGHRLRLTARLLRWTAVR
jgi:hypothetical protein